MKRLALLSLTVAWAGLALPGPATADECMCIANGQRYSLGETVCLKLSSGSWLARCGRVLNNTSWEKIGDGCPVSSINAPQLPETPQQRMSKPQSKG